MDGCYELCVYKNPKEGHKPPKIVRFVTNCWYRVHAPDKDERGNNLPAMVPKYLEVKRAVDMAKLMALQMHQVGRQTTWSHAVHAFMLRSTAGNAFGACKALGLV